MVSFWGSKKDARPAPDQLAGDDGPPPDEHTRLLPDRVDGDGQYLSPDDPAVSPYNLWTVRFVRYVTVFLTILTTLWWSALLVSTFVTPPGLHARGSTFLAFSFTSVALSNLIVILLSFAAPSLAARIMTVIIAIILLVDIIVIAAVRQTRHEELWIGIASSVWALLISVWTLVVERTVLWGKREEEERLTGRPESRRTLLEWTEVLFSTIGLLTIGLVTILLSLNLFLRAVDASLAPVGTRYWVNGDRYQIHIYCHGKKTDRSGQVFPTVLIEGGEVPVENGLWQFADNAIKNGSILRYCFSDRPGWGWSDDAPSPLTAGMAVDALSEALTHAAEDGPWILLSAGIGSIYSRVFAARHGSDVRGLVLVDPLHEDLLYRVASPKRGFLLWFKGFIAPLGLETLPGALFKGRSKEDRTWGRSAGLSGKTIFAKLQESLVADSFTKNDVTSARAIQDPDTPVVLISSGQEVRRDHEWSEGQRDLSKLTRNVKHWDIVDKAPHQVWETAEGRDQMEKRLSKLVFAERRDGRPPGPREGLEMLE